MGRKSESTSRALYKNRKKKREKQIAKQQNPNKRKPTFNILIFGSHEYYIHVSGYADKRRLSETNGYKFKHCQYSDIEQLVEHLSKSSINLYIIEHDHSADLGSFFPGSFAVSNSLSAFSTSFLSEGDIASDTS